MNVSRKIYVLEAVNFFFYRVKQKHTVKVATL